MLHVLTQFNNLFCVCTTWHKCVLPTCAVSCSYLFLSVPVVAESTGSKGSTACTASSSSAGHCATATATAIGSPLAVSETGVLACVQLRQMHIQNVVVVIIIVSIL